VIGSVFVAEVRDDRLLGARDGAKRHGGLRILMAERAAELSQFGNNVI
jgi:hypothetical protein